MNGPDHYRRAEALLRSAQLPGVLDIDDQGDVVEIYPATEDDGGDQDVNSVGNALLAAQVHATLALTAAMAYAAETDHLGDENRSSGAWVRVIS